MKSSNPHDFTGELYPTFKEVTQILIRSIFFQQIKEEETLFNSLSEVSTILILKSGEDITRKEKYRLTSCMNIDIKNSSTKF